ncbi:alkaline phosphatase [Aquabacterium sp.]|uniref:alkaline phosphatase n=1 Tax=Aquabacterium sp. TaxID=1872578 RepID=UPI003784F8BC
MPLRLALLPLAGALLHCLSGQAHAAPQVARLTPPSELFASGQPEPVIARFLPGQRFDLQATLRPDAGQRISAARFFIDGRPVDVPVALRDCTSGCVKGLAPEVAIATVRAVGVERAGRHEFTVVATQADQQTVTARGNFEVVPFTAAMGPKVRNLIILLGDGMGAAQRTAARIVKNGYAQGKALAPLAMDTFPATALVKTASLNSVVTDSSPGMTAYVSGNKNNNNEEGVFPDDTLDPFDNPRIEYLSEYLHRTQGKALGVVTTADVFDATPAGNAVHTSSRGAGTGIVDQFLDDRSLTGLAVLMGGGRKWFLPAGTPGSERAEANDYAFSATQPHTAEIVRRWGAAPGAKDKGRDLIQDFQQAGFRYAATKTEMDAAAGADKLLGLFAFSNMNVALDKINGRRGVKTGLSGSVVDDFGFPDQPMLDEMTMRALAVLRKQPKGFVLMVEGASIDKQAHNMDTERWMLDTIEFDRAVQVAQDFARERGDTLVIVTADHECSGAALIGGSMLTDLALQQAAQSRGAANLRDKVVGVYEKAGFPRYKTAADGYPVTTDIDHRLLVGYGANADRIEDWRTNATPLRDSQQPLAKQTPLKWYPANPSERDDAVGEFAVTGQVPGDSAVHTATDIPLSAFGPGALAFTGVIDNTDVFFKLAQAAVKGVTAPADASGARRPKAAVARKP